MGFILSGKRYLSLAIAVTPGSCAIRETGYVKRISEPKGKDKYYVSDLRVKSPYTIFGITFVSNRFSTFFIL